MKELCSNQIIIDKIAATRTLTSFWIVLNRGYSCDMIVHTRAHKLILKILIEQFDTLPTQCRHIKHVDAGIWFKNSILDKMTALRTLTFFWLLLNKGCACA